MVSKSANFLLPKDEYVFPIIRKNEQRDESMRSNEIELYKYDNDIIAIFKESSKAFIKYLQNKITYDQYYHIWKKLNLFLNKRTKIYKNIVLPKNEKLSKIGLTSNIYMYNDHRILKKINYKNNENMLERTFMLAFI